MNSADDPSRDAFTAAEIAAALGRASRTVRAALEGTASNGSKAVRGQVASAWTLAALPSRLRDDLRAVAVRKGYRDAQNLLANPPQRWTPPLALAEMAAPHLDRAKRLARVLNRALAHRDDPAWPALLPGFLDEYRREFGAVSDRHWRRVFNRTIDRDAGEERFDDLALYLEENLTRKPAAPLAVSEGDRRVYEACMRLGDPERPTVRERDLLWPRICEEIGARIAAGIPEKRARREVAELLRGYGVGLARNGAALRSALKRKHEAWKSAAGRADALCDQRLGKSGRPREHVLSDAERLRVTAHAVHHCGGRIHQALRECARDGVLSPVAADAVRFAAEVPRALVQEVRSDVRGLMPLHHGPREQRLSGPYLDRDWSAVCAGDFYQGDDTTAPVYWYEIGDSGPELMRGQWLVFIDLRSLFVLAHVLIPEAAYSAVHVRGLMTRAMAEHGLPRRGFYFERNIWQRACLVTGPKDVPWEKLESGFQRDFGLSFRHADLPRSKPVERVFGHLQNRMERLPGYCGRDERHDRYERLQKRLQDTRAGRAPVNQHFLSKEEMAGELQGIVDACNREPQRGRMLDGMSPLEGWLKLQGPEPRARFDERCAHLLSHVRTVPLPIRHDGLRFTLGGQRFAYFDAQTGARVGQKVVVYLNPDVPDLAFCEPAEGGEMFAVQRSNPLPAMDATPEDFAREKSLVNEHLGYQRALYQQTQNVLPETSFRRTIIDAGTIARAEQIREHSAEAQATARSRRGVRAKIDRACAPANVPAGLVEDSETALEALGTIAAIKRRRAESGAIQFPTLQP